MATLIANPTSCCVRPDAQKPERLLPAWDHDPRCDDPAQMLEAATVHGAFRAFVLDPRYTCVGAKSAINNGSYRMGLYPELGSAESALALSQDLERFVARVDEIDAAFATFVAVFRSPLETDEVGFESLLWQQLQLVHEIDAQQHAWDPSVSNDPEDVHFSFSVAGCAFFIVGLHPGSGRLSRRFPWPTLVFNPHAQFERLRAEGKWGRMQQVIRQKEVELQGEINPVLQDYGNGSEARQYSGRPTEPDWRPPFVAVDAPDKAAKEASLSKCPFARLARLMKPSTRAHAPR